MQTAEQRRLPAAQVRTGMVVAPACWLQLRPIRQAALPATPPPTCRSWAALLWMVLEKATFQLAASERSEYLSGCVSRLSAPRLCTGGMRAISCNSEQGGMARVD